MIALDSNILVYAHRSDSSWHERAAGCVTRLAEGRSSWAIPWPCIHEFLAIVTHPGIYAPPSSLLEATGQVEAWLESPSLVLLAETDSYWRALRDCLEGGGARGSQAHDARIAALCVQHGIRELWTADRDFSRFADVPARNPLVAG
ncbi:MAG: type II toxin-antitoxin system VapC family toxin [Planctomycetota bacterium]